jgi:PAS domain S-box-containing protein
MAATTASAETPGPVPDDERVDILIVDDRPDKILSLEVVLESLGQNLVKATSGKEALRYLLQQDFAVILLDVHMPEMDGFETAAMIRQRKNSEKTPIIFVTAVSDLETHVTRGYSLGAVDYIRTPIEPEILRAKVAVFVDLFRKNLQVKRQAEALREIQEREHKRLLADATDRLETETRRNRFFTLAVDMLAIAGFDLHFKQLNPTWRETLGFTDEELKERPLVEFVHEEDRAAVSGQLEQVKQGAHRTYFESRVLRRDAEARWLGWTAVPFPQEGLIYLFARDITDRKRAEEERVQLILEQSARAAAEAAERRAAFLADLSSVLSASLDLRTTLSRMAHVAVPRIADWCLLDVLADDGQLQRLEVVGPDDAPAAIQQALRSTPPQAAGQGLHAAVIAKVEPILVRDPRAEGMERLAEGPEQLDALRHLAPRSAMVVPLSMRGRTLAVLTLLSAASGRRYGPSDLGLAEEMSRRAAFAIENAWLYKESQEARRSAEAANRAKDEFLATLSHELRTPLSPILGWTLMLRSGSLDTAATTRALEVIERNVRAQTQLIEDLLDVSRIVTGKLRLDVQVLPELATVVEAGIESVRPSAEARGLHLDVVLDRTVGPVRGDADRLQQVVWNLLSNAVKFTPREGRVRVELAGEGGSAQIVVTDSGKGIGPEFLPYVFDRFRQADSSSTRMHGGLGLGLAIVRHLVELHGGTVEARSGGDGQGSTFVVNLPLLEATEPVAPSEDAAVESGDPAAQLAGLKILVVDDEADMRDFLTVSLSRHGARVASAGSASEALAAVDTLVPDVLISDIGMPDEDGYSLIRKLRTRDAAHGGRVPAAALTAYAMGEDGARALAAGFQMHLAKPINPTLLATAVAALAGRKG